MAYSTDLRIRVLDLARSQSPDWERGESSSSLVVLQEAGASKTGFPSWELGNQPNIRRKYPVYRQMKTTIF